MVLKHSVRIIWWDQLQTWFCTISQLSSDIRVLYFVSFFLMQPIPGFISRPDRILVSDRYFAVRMAEVRGHGPDYAEKFKHHIRHARQAAILEAAKRTYYRQPGGNCIHDCGPHGSCRCGICVGGGDKNACPVPDCHECTTEFYRHYLIIKFLSCAFVLQLCIAAIQIGLSLYRGGTLHRHRTIFQVPTAVSLKRMRHLYISSCLNMCRSLAILNFLIGLGGLWTMGAWSQAVFGESTELVNNILPEEFNPSDHLMVISEVDLTWNWVCGTKFTVCQKWVQCNYNDYNNVIIWALSFFRFNS